MVIKPGRMTRLPIDDLPSRLGTQDYVDLTRSKLCSIGRSADMSPTPE